MSHLISSLTKIAYLLNTNKQIYLAKGFLNLVYFQDMIILTRILLVKNKFKIVKVFLTEKMKIQLVSLVEKI